MIMTIDVVSDLIALSVVMAVGACSGPQIPLRGGRIDATEGGEFGVPEPESSIEDTLSRLQLAGFDQSDSIALTACGHTMGSVHNGGFPQVGKGLLFFVGLRRHVSIRHLIGMVSFLVNFVCDSSS